MGEAKTMVALIGNPVSNKGWGAVVGEQVFTMLAEAGQRHGFDVMDLTGTSFDDSLTAARENRALYDYLVVVGGDGMIALGPTPSAAAASRSALWRSVRAMISRGLNCPSTGSNRGGRHRRRHRMRHLSGCRYGTRALDGDRLHGAWRVR